MDPAAEPRFGVALRVGEQLNRARDAGEPGGRSRQRPRVF